MAMEFELVGTTQRWRFEQGPVTVGRDPASGIELPAATYAGVSRTHAVLRLEGGHLKVEDLHSGNGTYVNGVRITLAEVAPGDIVRFGPDGPELRILSGGAQPATVRSPAAATVMMAAAGAGATRAAMESASTVPAAARPAPAAPAATVVTPVPSPAGRKRSTPAHTPLSEPAPPVAVAASSEQVTALERALARTQRLLTFTVLLVAALLILVLYQSSQIADNRAALDRMQHQAQNAVATMMPQLDQRLQSFDARMDGMDTKMQAAENQFMARLNTELPALLDRYIEQRLAQAGKQLLR